MAEQTSKKRRGRPQLQIRPTQVRMDDADLKRIDDLLGPGKRAVFIREATREKLDRIKRGLT